MRHGFLNANLRSLLRRCCRRLFGSGRGRSFPRCGDFAPRTLRLSRSFTFISTPLFRTFFFFHLGVFHIALCRDASRFRRTPPCRKKAKQRVQNTENVELKKSPKLNLGKGSLLRHVKLDRNFNVVSCSLVYCDKFIFSSPTSRQKAVTMLEEFVISDASWRLFSLSGNPYHFGFW